MSASQTKDGGFESIQDKQGVVFSETIVHPSTSSSTISTPITKLSNAGNPSNTRANLHHKHAHSPVIEQLDGGQDQDANVGVEDTEDDGWSHVATCGNDQVSGSKGKVSSTSCQLYRWLCETHDGNMTFTEKLERSK
ncbi:hypothetical protein EG329_001156 [Mollisiaceae sp. DMI_Dod_QoI]|nr:hypothetical protein EG329_001156 [Helotiales sp. DMI_Dod_QoI]